MRIEQIYTACLAEATYYIESDGEAAIIDPLRDPAPYLERAAADRAKIKYVLETHFHADFVSGHLDLAKLSGATIVFGPTAAPAYAAHVAKDGEILTLGRSKIKVLHTPGHTMESTTYLLIDETGQDIAAFTGDTLFVGDVGRPDLVQKLKAEITPELLAGHLFDSLRQKIMKLPDDVLIYPGHGAGSACGKKMDKATVSTIGIQKKLNYALRETMTREEFIHEVLDGLTEPPQYFPGNVLMNIKGSPNLQDVLHRGLKALDARSFHNIWKRTNATVIDTRSKAAFPAEFVKGSIFIGIDDSFAPWVGTLIDDLNQPILIIADDGKEEEVIKRLARVGYDNAQGYLKNGVIAWIAAGEETDTIEEISASQFEEEFQKHPTLDLLDVRRASEFTTEHMEGAFNFPLESINRNIRFLDSHKTYYVYCAGGYRSLIATSILKSRGIANVVNIQNGFNALRQTSLNRTAPVQLNTEL